MTITKSGLVGEQPARVAGTPGVSGSECHRCGYVECVCPSEYAELERLEELWSKHGDAVHLLGNLTDDECSADDLEYSVRNTIRCLKERIQKKTGANPFPYSVGDTVWVKAHGRVFDGEVTYIGVEEHGWESVIDAYGGPYYAEPDSDWVFREDPGHPRVVTLQLSNNHGPVCRTAVSDECWGAASAGVIQNVVEISFPTLPSKRVVDRVEFLDQFGQVLVTVSLDIPKTIYPHDTIKFVPGSLCVGVDTMKMSDAMEDAVLSSVLGGPSKRKVVPPGNPVSVWNSGSYMAGSVPSFKKGDLVTPTVGPRVGQKMVVHEVFYESKNPTVSARGDDWWYDLAVNFRLWGTAVEDATKDIHKDILADLTRKVNQEMMGARPHVFFPGDEVWCTKYPGVALMVTEVNREVHVDGENRTLIGAEVDRNAPGAPQWFECRWDSKFFTRRES